MDLGTKPACMEFVIKAGLDEISVVAPLVMMSSVIRLSHHTYCL